ncbi:MAG: NAD-dependent succinate-semialdehyde dehydrogenase [Acidobacteriota bacterium]
MTEYRSLDPTTGDVLERFQTARDDELDAAIDAAARAFTTWRRRPLSERTAVLEKAALELERGQDDLATLMAVEMGKPIAQGRGEVAKCAWVCRHYAEHAGEYLRPEAAESDGRDAHVRFDPLGPILAIMPWNFPLWQVFRFAAPALVAGNVVLLKHAPNTPGAAEAVEGLFKAAGAPAGVLQNLFLSNNQAARAIEHRAVRGVTLTGSTGAGRSVAALAGRALKPMVAELGGSDPFMIFADADLDAAVAQGVASRALNNGQSCIAAKRVLIEASVYDEVLDRLVADFGAKRVGDPQLEETEVGPLARADLRDQLARQVTAAVEAGARALCGGEPPDGPGFFYPPTVLTGLDPRSDIAREEFFGPVLTVYPFQDEAEALEIANGTDYGLGASLWTRDGARVERLIPELDFGSVFVNGMVKSDPRLPFGGTKASGFGRELARDGLLEFVNVKTIWRA